jgi:hypothetical protein
MPSEPRADTALVQPLVPLSKLPPVNHFGRTVWTKVDAALGKTQMSRAVVAIDGTYDAVGTPASMVMTEPMTLVPV